MVSELVTEAGKTVPFSHDVDFLLAVYRRLTLGDDLPRALPPPD